MTIQEMDCMGCSGRGKFFYICKNKYIPCVECNSTGKQMRDPAWVERGAMMRRARVDAGKSLGETARQMGLTPVELSAMERGRSDPAGGRYDD